MASKIYWVADNVSEVELNITRLKRSRSKPKAGDEFTFRLPSTEFGFGRVIRNDARVGPIENVVLIYIFNGFSESKQVVPSFGPSDLLVPPLLTNRRPWSEGYFENVAFNTLTSEDVLQRHCFRDIRGFFFDEFGERLESEISPCGSYGVESFRTIDDIISTAIGIPLAE